MKLFYVVMVVFLSACTSSPKLTYSPKVTNLSWPVAGYDNTVQVGDKMLSQGSFAQHDSIIVRSPIKLNYAYTILPGTYHKVGSSETGNFYKAYSNDGHRGVQATTFADVVVYIKVNTRGKICGVTASYKVSYCADSRQFEKGVDDVVTKDSFQQTLLYSGRVGNKVKIAYREFSANIARPAFSNDVEYDLSETNVIGYKGARIEVVRANNESITYKVIQNFR